VEFKVRLKEVHDKTGLTTYAVAKRAGVAINTVNKYTEANEVTTKQIEHALVRLLDFYGLDWRDPYVIEVIESPEKANHLSPAFNH
jgi:transcriptional regulator with XRE-family HTH domain